MVVTNPLVLHAAGDFDYGVEPWKLLWLFALQLILIFEFGAVLKVHAAPETSGQAIALPAICHRSGKVSWYGRATNQNGQASGTRVF